MTSEHVDKSRRTDHQQQQQPFKVRFRDALAVSRTACRQGVDAMAHNARDYSYQQWYIGYVQDEFGAALFDQELKNKAMPSDTLVQQVVKFANEYPFSDENAVVLNFPDLKRTALMAFNPGFVASPNRAPVEPEIAPFWTDPAVAGPDNHIAGLLSQTSGRLRHYVTGHLKTIQSPITCDHFDEIQHVKVPTFWSIILNPPQLQHGLESISKEEISQDGWVRCADASTTPLELLKPFEYSLLELTDKTPDGHASCVAFVNTRCALCR